MRAVLQRVSEARIEVAGEVTGAIGKGLMVLLGVSEDDCETDVRYLADKTAGLRIFEDDGGKMNLSVADIGGSILVASQFTLYGDCRKGRRPSFTAAASPEKANDLYEKYVARLRSVGLNVATGIFQADMKVHLVNDGPVTMLIDSTKEF